MKYVKIISSCTSGIWYNKIVGSDIIFKVENPGTVICYDVKCIKKHRKKLKKIMGCKPNLKGKVLFMKDVIDITLQIERYQKLKKCLQQD